MATKIVTLTFDMVFGSTAELRWQRAMNLFCSGAVLEVPTVQRRRLRSRVRGNCEASYEVVLWSPSEGRIAGECSCADSDVDGRARLEGILCKHAVAVALAALAEPEPCLPLVRNAMPSLMHR